MSYAFDSMDKMIENKTTDAGKLHDKIEIEKGANKNGSLFENFFDSQNYSTKGKDGKVTEGNHIIDLLQQMYQNRENKKEYNRGFNQLMQLISDFQNQQSKK
jgi:hypothetical protein